MTTTKFNIERQFIEDANIVDPIDQASFQGQIQPEFEKAPWEPGGENVFCNIDVSQGHFFMVDCDDAGGSEEDYLYFNIKNATTNDRFELLLRESNIVKKLAFGNWDGPAPELVKFSFRTRDIDGNIEHTEPMEAYSRRQMLITFRSVQNSLGQTHIIGIPTPWFESQATHGVCTTIVMETINNRPPSNIMIDVYLEKEGEAPIKIREEEVITGYNITLLPRVPSKFTQAQQHYKYVLKVPTTDGMEIMDTKEILNSHIDSGRILLSSSTTSSFIPVWETSRSEEERNLVALPYKKDAIVKHNPGGICPEFDGETYHIFRRNELYDLLASSPDTLLEPGFYPDITVNELFQHAYSTLLGMFSWDKWFPTTGNGGVWKRFVGGVTDPTNPTFFINEFSFFNYHSLIEGLEIPETVHLPIVRIDFPKPGVIATIGLWVVENFVVNGQNNHFTIPGGSYNVENTFANVWEPVSPQPPNPNLL